MPSIMEKSLLTRLRDRKTGTALFRETAEKLTHLLAEKSFHYLKGKKMAVQTPLAKTTGFALSGNIVLVPILRAGLGFLPTFLYYFKNAKIGFIGLKRDEKTAEPREYYRNLPKIAKTDQVIALDPMIATGGSAVAALRALKERGAREKQIVFVAFIAAPSGLRRVRRKFPAVKVIVSSVEKGLNKDKFILPGLGDFGDRFFGTV